MRHSFFSGRLLDNTRTRIVLLLRRGARTVEELAKSVEITDNAVRSQLTALERDGIVRQNGVRRTEGAGKPAVVYEVHPAAEPLFSAAYPPVLTSLLQAVVERLPADQADALLRRAGERLAATTGGVANGDLEQRMNAAGALLTSLGAEVDVAKENGVLTIRGYGCPLSVAVSARPEACETIRSLVSGVTGSSIRQCCTHGEQPRCGFQALESAATD